MTEQTQAAAAPAPGSPEYDAAMAAKFRATKEPAAAPQNEIEAAAQAGRAARPEHVPAKFWREDTGEVNVDALLKSYTELEKVRGAAPKTAIPGDQPAATQAGDVTAEDAATRQAVQAAGLDWDALGAKLVQTGKLDDAEYAALAAKGVPKEVVDGYGKLLVDRAESERKAAVEYAGGEEASQRVLAWAAKNLPENEKARYNAALASPDWRMAVDSLKARMAAASPTAGEPALAVAGNSAGAPAGYRSRSEMKADMANPMYSKDPGFRQKVAERLRFASWDLDR